jgi:uncharacterized protein involved in exopolysaccharide biosynthesis
MAEHWRRVEGQPCSYGTAVEEGGINLLEYWRVIWKRRKMIGWIVAITVLTAFIFSLFLTNIYQARAVIIPVTRDSMGSSSSSLGVLAQQFGGLPGIAMPASSTTSEIMSLLNSNILREKMIRQYNLMPILFYNDWDVQKQAWKQGHSNLSINPLYYVSLLVKAISPASAQGPQKKDPDVPDTWDALRLLAEMVTVSRNSKENTITISAEFHDPELAARIVDYFLVTLTDYMSAEAKRVAAINRKYLEEQLGSTADPFIKQKTYNMIAQQIETGMMAEVKENFAFKMIDPPLAPDKTIKPKRGQIVLLSMVMSLFLGICIAFFLEYLNKVKTKKVEVGK